MTLQPWLAVLSVLAAAAIAGPARAQRWAAVWAAPGQGPFPAGVVAGQPSLAAAFPNPQAGAREQTFRLVVKPDVFGRLMRFRFSNAFGTRPVTFDAVFVGLQMSGAAVVPGTLRPISFAGKPAVAVAPGGTAWSDPVALPFVREGDVMAGRKLAVTFHVPGESGPMTWHALAMTTSYVTAPEAGATSQLEDDSAFPFSATSWFFLDAVDAMLPGDTRVVVCLGDGVTDGAGSTLNGDDRWTDVLSRRLHAAGGHVAVVNAGLAGNTVLGAAEPGLAGGPPALARLQRDVIGLSGVTDVIWLEGEGDLLAGAEPDAVGAALAEGAAQMRAGIKGVKLLGGTLTSARGSPVPGAGTPDADRRRHALNALVGKPGLFDAAVDFDAATVDPATGELRPEFVAPSSGGVGDRITLNRPGYLAMGGAVELRELTPPPRPAPRPRPKPAAKPAEETAPALSGSSG